MATLHIVRARVRPGSYVLELALSDGSSVLRDFALVRGPAFDPIWRDRTRFRRVRVTPGALVWPGGVDVDSDAVLWGGLPHGRPLRTATIGARGTLLDDHPVRELRGR